MTQLIIFRTDASVQIGSGHLMRCLTMAEALRKFCDEILFICRKHVGNLNQMIRNKGFIVHELEVLKNLETCSISDSDPENEYSGWLGTSQEEDAQETINLIRGKPPDWLIVDHYALGEIWEHQLRPHVKKIMVIDDLANRKHDCDLLLDQNFFLKNETRYKGLIPPNCSKMLGPKYALLRTEFAIARKNTEPRTGKIKRIFVFFGGSDPNNITEIIIKVLSDRRLEHLTLDVVIGEQNPFREKIKKICQSRKSTYLHVQVDDMASIMSKADIAIGAGGVNTWERMCLKIPSFSISTSENQKILLKDLVKGKYIYYIGDSKCIKPKDIKEGILDLINKPSSELKKGNAIMDLVDGSGTARVIKELMNNVIFISIVSDFNTWINHYITKFINKIKNKGYIVIWEHDINNLQKGDICFLIGCSQIMSKKIMSLNKINLVVHESKLPKGKGWSPLTWQIIEGNNTIPITLLEVKEQIDSGKIFLQDVMIFDGHELIDELHDVQAKKTFRLCEEFIENYPDILEKGIEQTGKETFYKRRNVENSELNIEDTLVKNFNLLRTVDNDRYPAFFFYKGYKYKLQIEKFTE